MKHKHFNRLLSILLVVAALFGLMALPASAATLENSGTVSAEATRLLKMADEVLKGEGTDGA